MAKKPLFEIADIYKFRGVSDPQMAPDGSRVAYVEERVDRAGRKYLTTLSLVDFRGGKWSFEPAHLRFARRAGALRSSGSL